MERVIKSQLDLFIRSVRPERLCYQLNGFETGLTCQQKEFNCVVCHYTMERVHVGVNESVYCELEFSLWKRTHTPDDEMFGDKVMTWAEAQAIKDEERTL